MTTKEIMHRLSHIKTVHDHKRCKVYTFTCNKSKMMLQSVFYPSNVIIIVYRSFNEENLFLLWAGNI